MTKQNTAKAAQPATDLRQRAARARDAAGRFIKRPVVAETSAAAADPVYAAIERHLAERAACVGLDDGLDKEGYEAAHDRRFEALEAVEDTRPTTVAGLFALARHMDDYLSEDAGGDNIVEATSSGHAFVALINSCLDLQEATILAAKINAPPPPPVSAPHPDAALFALGAEFVAAWAAEEETADGAGYRACNQVARQIVRTPASTAAGLGIKALLLARLDEDDSSPRNPVAAQGPIASHWNVLRQVQDGAARIAAGLETGIPVTADTPAGPSLVALLDLSSATMVELRTIRELSDHVGTSAYAHSWRGCCHRRDNPVCASDYNQAGKLMQWIGDALTDVETAVDNEVARRIPKNGSDRETRLSVRAVPIIDDGDPDAIEAFARELLDHAAAERRRH